ncbi:hypothetical protein C8J57DRAFT_1366222 [Mycena rebaudengoi]|nr:hypothetical protein C8J57DRAFT_1366222 [Mycena rebaudengoi]
MWVGPSVAAEVVRTLVDAFPACGLGVFVATDGTLYQTEVYAASHTPVAAPPLISLHSHGSQASHTSYASSFRASSSHAAHASSSSHASHASHPSTSSYASSKLVATTKRWGGRPVLLLLGIDWGSTTSIRCITRPSRCSTPSLNLSASRAVCRSSSYYFVGV